MAALPRSTVEVAALTVMSRAPSWAAGTRIVQSWRRSPPDGVPTDSRFDSPWICGGSPR